MMKGTGSVEINYGSGSRRPKNIGIRRFRILNTGQNCHLYLNVLARTEQNETERYWYLEILPDIGLEHSLEALH